MRLSQPLDDLLHTKSYSRVLRAIEGLPAGIEASTREIARRAGVSHPTASGVLESLRRQGIVHVRRTLWADEFVLNERHVLTKPLRALFVMEQRLLQDVLDYLVREIRTRADWISRAYLFGSAARGDMQVDSDLDVAVICPPRKVPQAEKFLEDLSARTAERFGNRVHGVVGTRPIVDLARAGQPGYRLWKAIAKEGIDILGSTDGHQGGGT
jgi:predicted nucleotidyltransferase